MSKKVMIKRLIAVAIILFFSGLITISFEDSFLEEFRKNKQGDLNSHINKLADDNIKYLSELSKELKELPLTPTFIDRVTRDIERDKLVKTVAVWVSDEKGEFMEGIPKDRFRRLNKIFDNYKSLITKGYFSDRNDFFSKVAVKMDIKNLRKYTLERDEELRYPYNLTNDLVDGWSHRRYFTSWISSHSVPINGVDGKMLGRLHIGVNDFSNINKYKRYPGREDSFLLWYVFPFAEVLIPLSVIFAWIMLPAFVYIDSNARGMRNSLALVFFTAVSFVLGFTIYMIIRPSKGGALNCPSCSKELDGTNSFCPYCGHDLSGDFCPACQYPIDSDWEYCPGCRKHLKKSSADSTEEVPQETSEEV